MHEYQDHNRSGIAFLREMIAIPAFSREETQAASAITKILALAGVSASRVKNNVFASNLHYDASKPTILLNSHLDTVKPNSGYSRDPYEATIEEENSMASGVMMPAVASPHCYRPFYIFIRKKT